MNSLTDLREVVDVVIGVDTHVHTHSAAVVDTATGGVLDEITVEATPEGYAELVEFANNHATLRAWAIEGTGGHGAGLSRHLLETSEIVIEFDRPKRAARRNGAKSDPLDAIRAAREAMARPQLGTPRSGIRTPGTVGAFGCSPLCDQRLDRGAAAGLQPGDRRTRTHPSPVPWSEACRDAQHRCEPAVHSSWDVETTSTVVALRTLARRAHAMLKEARELQKAIVAIIRSWRPDLLEEFGVGPIVAATVLCAWSHPGGSIRRQRSRCSPAWHRSRRTVASHHPVRLNRYGDVS